MLQRLQNRTHGMAAFFKAAVFTSFFFGDRTSRAIAWSGSILLGLLAITNALTAFYLMSLMKIVGDMCQGNPTSAEVLSYVWPFVGVFTWLFVIEPLNELGKMYFVVRWTEISSRWFSDHWIAEYKRRHFCEAPKGASEMIVERTAELTQALMEMYVPLCRAVVIICAFGYMTFHLSESLWPALAEYVPGWLLLALLVWSALETLGSHKLGNKLPELLDDSRKKRASFRSHLEEFEKRMKGIDNMPLRERARFRKEARARLDTWLRAYLLTFRDNFKLLTWKSGNQQACQFALLAGLGLLTAAKFFSLGTMSATVYAVNEMRGALLTLSHSWLIVAKIQSLARGLRELEHTVYLNKFPQDTPYLIAAE